MLFVRKKDESIMLSIDSRKLNKVTIRNKYPFPQINDSFDQFQGSCLFSKINLQLSNQPRVKSEDVP